MLNPGPNSDWDEPSQAQAQAQAQAWLMEEKQAQTTSELLISSMKSTHQHLDQETEHRQYSEAPLPEPLTPSKRDHHADSDTMNCQLLKFMYVFPCY